MADTQITPLYMDPNQPVEARSKDLIARMTLAEKVSQLMYDAAPVERLGVPAYQWWNEALHGVGRAGLATVFPQAIGMAATWNEDLVFRMANIISDEARAKYHQALRQGKHGPYTGLTYWSPNINIFRDPRWGRGQETLGEDPFLTARMGVQFVRGMQGDHPRYLKTAACAKHYAVHSGPEAERHQMDVRVSLRDLKMTYLPAFEALVREGQVAGVMGAYNRVNGEACCASWYLMRDVLRGAWGFEGYTVSDYGAIWDIYQGHKLAESPVEAAALALLVGCNLNAGDTYEYLLPAVGRGLLTERDIDRALTYLFNIRFRLGMFDPEKDVPYASIPAEAIDAPGNQALALEVARQSIVLLKNEGGVLPLGKNLNAIAVIGPNAADELVMLGNYYGTPSQVISVLDGIKSLVSPSTEIMYSRGCDILDPGQDGFAEAIQFAEKADVVLMVMGLSQRVEGEEGQTEGVMDGQVSLGDREHLDLPGEQEALLQAVAATGKPIVLVLLSGSALSIRWADEHVPAILVAWYPGQMGGRAVAEALFGDYNPGGKLPVTFYQSVDQLPPFEDYAMAGRTYRYFEGEVLYSFGYGLSYTSFEIQNLWVSHEQMSSHDTLRLSCEVVNTGAVIGDEVVQVYLKDEEASVPVPRHSLVGFKRVRLAPGWTEHVAFEIQPKQFALVNDDGKWMLEPGMFTVFVGGGQPGTVDGVSRRVELLGPGMVIE